MNTPRVVQQETKKAFRNIQKKSDLQSACNALCNLKGVGPAMASGELIFWPPKVKRTTAHQIKSSVQKKFHPICSRKRDFLVVVQFVLKSCLPIFITQYNSFFAKYYSLFIILQKKSIVDVVSNLHSRLIFSKCFFIDSKLITITTKLFLSHVMNYRLNRIFVINIAK